MFRKIFVIVNPASGKVEPTLYYINSILGNKITWDMNITKNKGDAALLAKHALRKKYDAIAVYGGDGTVAEVATTLFRKKTPLIVLPGGTANVMAKDIGIPADTQEAVKLILEKKPKIKKLDVGIINGEPFTVGVNVGFTANIMKSALRTHKNKFGRLAYGISMIKHWEKDPPESTYTITAGNKTEVHTGIGMIVTNYGSVGISNLSLINSISPTDGKLDVIIFKTASINTLFQVAQSTILNVPLSDQIVHKRLSTAKISIDPPQLVEKEDVYSTESELHLNTAAKNLSVLVP